MTLPHFIRHKGNPSLSARLRRFGLVLASAVMAVSASAGGRVGEAAAQDQQAAAAADISPEALAQIDALIREKDNRSPVESKIDSQLLYEQRMERGQPLADGIWAVDTDLPYAPDGHLIIDLSASVTPGLLASLSALGAEVIVSTPESAMLRVHIDITELNAVAALPDVTFVQPRQDARVRRWDGPVRPGFSRRATRVAGFLAGAIDPTANPNVLFTQTGQGSRTTEGDITHLAFAARQAFGVNGTGVKIGVLSDGITNLAASQATGDLGPVTVLPGQAGSGDEGTAILEIIHDMVPGADLYFATAFNGIAGFAKNIRALRNAGCNIIVDDVTYLAETPFQDGQAPSIISNTNGGVVIQAVNDVTASGALFFSSAGNEGNLTNGTSGTWEGDFVDGGPTSAPLPAGRLHQFGSHNYDVITAASTSPTALNWSDPLGASANDYDLFRLNSAGTAVMASSTNIQNGKQDPFEIMSGGTQAVGQRIVIVKKASAEGRFLHLSTLGSVLSMMTSGETFGHNAAAAAFDVAATPAAMGFGSVGPFPQPFNSSNVIEAFSSDGPRRIFFRADGTPFTPGNVGSSGGVVLQKPDVTAADGVSVSGAGGFPSPFFGTSAAAPHAAAIAGLLLSANPTLTPAQVRTILTSSAVDIMAPGVDRDSGAGIVMANATLLAAGVPGTALLSASVMASDDPGNGNGAPEAGEGARLVIPLSNYGAAPARAISATLTSSTSGITITQPNVSTYPDLGISASASVPYRFTIASDFPCPKAASFVLTVTSTGGPSPLVFPFTVPIGPPAFNITTTLDAVPPTPSPGVLTTTGLQKARLSRNGTPSMCGSPKATPPLLGTGTRQFDAYGFNTCQNSVASCVTVTLLDLSLGNLFSAAYAPTFNPADVRQNYRADAGVSGNLTTYSFDLGAGPQSFVVDVHEVNQGLGVGAQYTLSVAGACGGACAPPNHPPIAVAKDVTAFAGGACTADASINAGSFDSDGDSLTITQTPPGPYPLGVTPVLLTVRDPFGATSQASASITVVDHTPPLVTGLEVSPALLWPPNHSMIDVAVTYNASDNCSGVTCVLTVSSNQPANARGDGNTAPDWEVVDAHHVRLRAERAGPGGDRIYTITLTCTDAAGNSTVQRTTVIVPHDQS